MLNPSENQLFIATISPSHSDQEEGDHLQPDELLAAASHRSQEESLRQTKPSELNGGRRVRWRRASGW
jgi:hypothetical protein